MKKTISILSGIFAFILLAAALPYFNIVDVHPVIGWLIGLGVLVGLPLLLISIIVISIRQFSQKQAPDEEFLNLDDLPEREEKKPMMQQRTDNDEYV
jgi:hypothetical protein